MSIIYRLLVAAGFIAVLGLVIAYARGYRVDLQQRSLSSTGILAISSYPTAAKIFVNGELKGVTNTNLTLAPGSYDVEIKKDGYTTWKKKIALKGELVLTLDALLFPLNPSLSPLTNLGIVKAVPLGQTNQVLIFTDNNDPTKDGIYLYATSSQPLSLFSPLKLLILKKNLDPTADFKKAVIYLSPDYKQSIIELPGDTTTTGLATSIHPPAFLISLTDLNTTAFDITNSKDTLLKAWAEQKQNDDEKILETFSPDVVKIASDSFHIISFAPNELKFLYVATQDASFPPVITPPLIATDQSPETRTLVKNHIYVYDKKEDKNFEITSAKLPVISDHNPNQWYAEINNMLIWYPDSKHLVFNDNKKIAIVDYDNTNKQTVYSGPFDNLFFTVSGDGSLLVLANLNPEANTFPDLYSVGIK